MNRTMFLGGGRVLSGPQVEHRVYCAAHSWEPRQPHFIRWSVLIPLPAAVRTRHRADRTIEPNSSTRTRSRNERYRSDCSGREPIEAINRSDRAAIRALLGDRYLDEETGANHHFGDSDTLVAGLGERKLAMPGVIGDVVNVLAAGDTTVLEIGGRAPCTLQIRPEWTLKSGPVSIRVHWASRPGGRPDTLRSDRGGRLCRTPFPGFVGTTTCGAPAAGGRRRGRRRSAGAQVV